MTAHTLLKFAIKNEIERRKFPICILVSDFPLSFFIFLCFFLEVLFFRSCKLFTAQRRMTTQREAYTVAYLSDHPEFIPQVAKNCWTEWPEECSAGGSTSVEMLEAEYRAMIANNNNNTTVGIPIVCFTTRKNQEGKEEKVLCGSCCVEAEDMYPKSGLTPWVTSVLVAEEFRRKGVAWALLRKAIEVARGLNVPQVYLWTEDHYGSLAFYKKCGFEEIKKMDYSGKVITIMHYVFKRPAKL